MSVVTTRIASELAAKQASLKFHACILFCTAATYSIVETPSCFFFFFSIIGPNEMTTQTFERVGKMQFGGDQTPAHARCFTLVPIDKGFHLM